MDIHTSVYIITKPHLGSQQALVVTRELYTPLTEMGRVGILVNNKLELSKTDDTTGKTAVL